MTQIRDLLSPTLAEQVKAIVTDVRPETPAALPTGTHEVDIDPRSGALIDAQCADCRSPIQIDPSMIDEDEDEVQTFLCDACTTTETDLRQAIVAQRNVEAIRRASVAKHRPRTTDGIDWPVTTTTTKETHMKINLDEFSDAELGSLFRSRMQATLASKIEEGRVLVNAQREVAAMGDRAGLAADQERRKGHVLPGFVVAGVTVPPLDLSDVTSLDESPSSAMRSPYNKARFRMLKQDALDPEETTYRTLEAEHLRLSVLAAQKPTTTAVLTDVGRQTKAAALAEVKGITIEAALAEMNALGI